MIAEKVLKLIQAICLRVQEDEETINKTKLLKLIYLIDLSHYKNHRTTISGFNWVFFEFGPWAQEFNEVFRMILDSPDFIVKKGGYLQGGYSVHCIDTGVEFQDIGIGTLDSLEFRSIIDRWAHDDLNRLLNYVYFYTEPMADAKKYEKLDFEKVFTLSVIPAYKREKSSVNKRELAKVKEMFLLSIAKEVNCRKSIEIKQVFDELYWNEIIKMEDDDSY